MNILRITKEEIDEGRKQYKDFLEGRNGHFYTNLFHTIATADRSNTYKLCAAFPECVFAYLEYIGDLRRLSWDIEGESIQEKLDREFPHINQSKAIKRYLDHE